jgi:TPR repeat protein
MSARAFRAFFLSVLAVAGLSLPSAQAVESAAKKPVAKPAVTKPSVKAPQKPTVAKPTVAKPAAPKPKAASQPRKARQTAATRKGRRGKAAVAAAGAGAALPAARLAAAPALPKGADAELVELDAKAREGNAEAQLELAQRIADQGPAAIPRARYWYQRAADQGDADAAYALGELARGGLAGRVNMPEAIGWYRKAADAGHADAMFDLGLIYAEGQGVPRDPAQAAQWFQDAADAGVARALFQLGALYELGVDGAPDLPTAAGWYREAARAGDVTGEAALDRLAAGGRNFLDGDEAVPGRGPKAAAARPAAVDQGAVKEIQTRLKALGYSVGRADGHLSKRTLAAIRAWQKANGQHADGRASQALLEQLRGSGAKG